MLDELDFSQYVESSNISTPRRPCPPFLFVLVKMGVLVASFSAFFMQTFLSPFHFLCLINEVSASLLKALLEDFEETMSSIHQDGGLRKGVHNCALSLLNVKFWFRN